MTIEEKAIDLLAKLRDAWTMRVVDADQRMLSECKYALQSERADMREQAAKIARFHIGTPDQIAQEIRDLK